MYFYGYFDELSSDCWCATMTNSGPTLQYDSSTNTYSGTLACKRCADNYCEECHDGYVMQGGSCVEESSTTTTSSSSSSGKQIWWIKSMRRFNQFTRVSSPLSTFSMPLNRGCGIRFHVAFLKKHTLEWTWVKAPQKKVLEPKQHLWVLFFFQKRSIARFIRIETENSAKNHVVLLQDGVIFFLCVLRISRAKKTFLMQKSMQNHSKIPTKSSFSAQKEVKNINFKESQVSLAFV